MNQNHEQQTKKNRRGKKGEIPGRVGAEKTTSTLGQAEDSKVLRESNRSTCE